MLQWKLDILKALKNEGYNQRVLLTENILSGTTVTILRKGGINISLKTLGKICQLLNCQPSELIEYIPDID